MREDAKWDVATWGSSLWDIVFGTYVRRKREKPPLVAKPPIPHQVISSINECLEKEVFE